VMFLTLGMMPYREVFVWRDVKHSTPAWRGGGKNTHGQPEEADHGERHSGMYAFAS